MYEGMLNRPWIVNRSRAERIGWYPVKVKPTAAELWRRYKLIQSKIDGLQSELADWAGEVYNYIHESSKETSNGNGTARG